MVSSIRGLYGLDTYGLRYFNVFGRRQDPNGAYAAVIPKFIKQLLDGEVPIQLMVMVSSPEISPILITLSKRI